MHAKSPRSKVSPFRLVAWTIAVAAGFCLGFAWRSATAIERSVGAILTTLLVVLLGEIVSAILGSPSNRSVAIVRALPADGKVGIAPIPGLRSEPNPSDPRWSGFVSLESSDRKPMLDEPAPLLGRVVIFSLFVGRDGQTWSVEEIARAHKSLIRAGEWIEGEAIRWRAPVNIELAEVYFIADDNEPEDVTISLIDEGDHAALFESDPVTKALASASRAALAIGFHDIADLVNSIGVRVDADARVWLLHFRRAGRSHAIAVPDAPIPGLSMAVCYAREANFPEPLTGPPFSDPVTFVHEFLHLFGALDKYGLSLRSFAPRSVTSRDVMRLDSESLSRLQIDPATASEIGWA